MFKELQNYFLISEDKNLHIFDVSSSPYESIITESQSFNAGSHRIDIIDSFNGKRPVLFNYDLFKNKTTEYKFYPTVIIDSHIASGLHQYVTNRKQFRESNFNIFTTIEHFLKFVIDNEFDFNPAFYFIESHFKNNELSYYQHVQPVARSILTLHSMKKQQFLETGNIVADNEAVDFYYAKYAKNSIEGCATAWLDYFNTQEAVEYKFHLDYMYALLLKMVLIHKKDNKGPVKKIDQFEKFMLLELGFRGVFEFQIALVYFSGLTGRFINIETNMNINTALGNLKACSWDIFLLRLPSLFLNASNLPEIILGYVCTAEKKLADLANLFQIEGAFCYSDDSTKNRPVIGIKMNLLDNMLGQEKVDKIRMQSEDITNLRSQLPNRKKITHEALLSLITDLEWQLSNYCKG